MRGGVAAAVPRAGGQGAGPDSAAARRRLRGGGLPAAARRGAGRVASVDTPLLVEALPNDFPERNSGLISKSYRFSGSVSCITHTGLVGALPPGPACSPPASRGGMQAPDARERHLITDGVAACANARAREARHAGEWTRANSETRPPPRWRRRRGRGLIGTRITVG